MASWIVSVLVDRHSPGGEWSTSVSQAVTRIGRMVPISLC
jgi:hypothetical protein